MRPWLPAAMVAALLSSGAAQTPPAGAGGAPALAADVPLQCWWRTSAGAIRLGEIVEVTLTCAVLESDAVRAVPDESRLSVASIQLAPFEIVGGTHPPDTRAGSRRFFQYAYQLRLIDADVIGRDVKLPPLSIPYRVQSRVGAGAALAGRDLVHLMPQIAIRLVSQVPAEASDIRDSGGVSLARIDTLRFRAGAYRMAAMVLAALGAIAVLAAFVPLVGRARAGRHRTISRVSDRAVLRQGARSLEELGLSGAQSDWPAATLGDAHRAVRLVAATALGEGVRQQPLEPGQEVPEGRVLVRHGPLGRRRTALTAHVTAATLARAVEHLPAGTPAAHRLRLERLSESLAALTRAQYGDGGVSEHILVDDAVRAAREVAGELARERLWSVRGWFAPATAQSASRLEF